ncbi:MAG TPA: PEP/pyruvate-binding domain-containing protein [Syntrophorhabdaceae bacterium]|nr:PEP/pyruvate-binding domain-containing protein [Syntrophorhabdaceae bacterium]
MATRVSTGLNNFDKVIDDLRTGDNVVWQVDTIEDYIRFVTPFAARARSEAKRLVYMRFARHASLVEESEVSDVYYLDANSGFESFSTQVYNIATKEGDGVFYLFDSLSDLLSAWATDLMIGNFFMLTCPYLYQLNTIAYFALLRDSHSFKTVARIRETTQLFLDIYNVEKKIYVHPLKVKGRYSPTMFLPHRKKEDTFVPVTSSVDSGRLFTYISGKGKEQAKRNLDYWDRLFIEVEEMLGQAVDPDTRERTVDHLCQILIGREDKILKLAREHFSLEDLLDVKSRLLGTGYVGGKTVGMLLARKILMEDASFDWRSILEPHDSFFVGSDVFYTYIVENGWWKLRMQQKTKEGYFESAKELHDKMLEGSFPDEIEEQFWRVIEYFGQSPIIIRSSSLLEDAFGNAFAGKYESIFSVNQGTPEERYRRFVDYIRRVFASTMNEDALAYRLQRGLDQLDEQMALLIQRVSGSYRGNYFFPDLAGVGNSYNTFVWRKDMDPKAGMLRLVLGLGTRAVNRVENDYPRIVALDHPLLRPLAGQSDVRRYSQHEADVLNIPSNDIETIPVSEIMSEEMKTYPYLIGTIDNEAAEMMRQRGLAARESWILTFDTLLSQNFFPSIMRRMLETLESKYNYPVDTEFTVNFTGPDSFQINLVQCRPLQTKGEMKRVSIPERIPQEKTVFRSVGNFMGGNTAVPVHRIIFVDPEKYAVSVLSEKYSIARLIGRLNKQIRREEESTLLIGPGRWGTTTPSLGVPVRFSEINNIAGIVELAHMTGSLMPELSFGTHFFQDLVETDIFYAALFPEMEQVSFNRRIIDEGPNILSTLVPESGSYESIIVVRNLREENLFLYADVISQRVICYSSLDE